MNHPYSSPAASAVYANEPDAAPTAKRPHFVPAPARPPGAYVSSWVAAGTYKVHTPPRADAAPARPPGYSQIRPLPPLPFRPLRGPTVHPPQKPAAVAAAADADDDFWWVSDSEADDAESEAGTDDTVVAPAPPPVTAASAPRELQFKTTIIRYEGEDAPLVARRPAPVPYELRPSERALAARKHAVWRKKIADIMCL